MKGCDTEKEIEGVKLAERETGKERERRREI